MHISGPAPRLVVGSALGLALVGGGVALSQVASAQDVMPAATPSASASVSGQPSAAPSSTAQASASARPTSSATTTTAAATTSASASASVSASPTPSSDVEVMRAECSVSDAEIQARYPGATATESTSKAGTLRIWRQGGTYVGQSMNGVGFTIRCPIR